MSPRTRPSARWVALPLVLAQLLLAGAAVPHCHAAAVPAEHGGAAEHPSPLTRPHRHWVWTGQDHAAGHHAPAASEPAGSSEHGRPDPAEHDGDAVYLADAFRAVVAGPVEHDPSLATVGVAPPWGIATPLPPAARRVLEAVRPPGDRLPALHDRLPHVLRL